MDSPFYVWRTAAVGVDGLDRIGTIRSAGPLLFAALARAGGRNVMTIAAIGPALVAGVAAAAAGGVARAALRVRAAWIPVFGLLVWSAFGRPGMVREQPDNALNAALVLAALAAALARAESGRGTAAVFALLLAAGLAHWPFYAVAAAAFALGIAWWGRTELRARLRRDEGAEGAAGPLLVAVGASGAAVLASFLGAARGVWRGPRLSELSDVLKGRFVRRVGELQRYPSVALAGAGALAAAREPAPPVPPRARGLFLSISGAWVLLVLGGVVAQAAGIPTAGIRLLNYLFPVTLLTGVFVWWAARRLSAGGSGAGRAAAAVVVVLVVAGFGALAWPGQLRGEPWYEPDAVNQIAAAGGVLEGAVARGELDPAAAVRFPIQIPERPNDRLTLERWRNTVLAILPPERAAHAVVVVTDVGDPLGLAGGSLESTGPTVAIRRYNPEGFELVRAADPRRAIEPGVAFADHSGRDSPRSPRRPHRSEPARAASCRRWRSSGDCCSPSAAAGPSPCCPRTPCSGRPSPPRSASPRWPSAASRGTWPAFPSAARGSSPRGRRSPPAAGSWPSSACDPRAGTPKAGTARSRRAAADRRWSGAAGGGGPAPFGRPDRPPRSSAARDPRPGRTAPPRGSRSARR